MEKWLQGSLLFENRNWSTCRECVREGGEKRTERLRNTSSVTGRVCGVSGLVQLTDSAKEYLRQVGKPNVYLSVKGGGCSGFQYVWDVTDETPTVENLVIDPIAEMFVMGCTVDYVTELGGSYLKVSNPNATASCGCGESFAV